jgi:hypothetical protein
MLGKKKVCPYLDIPLSDVPHTAPSMITGAKCHGVQPCLPNFFSGEKEGVPI